MEKGKKTPVKIDGNIKKEKKRKKKREEKGLL
jgi:hypothetical protein